MKKSLSASYKNKGQAITEYALILAVIAVVAVAVMTTMGQEVQAVFQGLVDSFSGGSSE